MTRKMKDSGIEWIGEIPEEWGLLRSKNYFVQSFSKGNDELILLSATQNNGVIPKDMLEGVVQVKENTDLSTFKTVHPGDYVISLRSFQGGFEMSDYEGVITPAYTVFRNRKQISNLYFKMLFKSDGFIAKMNSLTVGIRDGKNINYSDFANTLIPFPNIYEQKKIANFLISKINFIDQTIEKQKQLIEKLKEYKISIITEAVTKGLNADVRMKDSRIEWIGEIPEHWSICKLKNIGRVQGRIGFKGYTISDIVDENEKGRAIVLGGTNIMKDGYISYNKLTYLSESKYLESPEIMLYGGEILITKVGSGTGENALYTSISDRVTINPNVMLFICNNIEIAKYINYWLLSNYVKMDMFLESNKSGAQPAINQEYVKNIKCILPPINEQEKIIKYLDSKCSLVDVAINKKETLINKLETYKKSLIYECVTGKREVQ